MLSYVSHAMFGQTGHGEGKLIREHGGLRMETRKEFSGL